MTGLRLVDAPVDEQWQPRSVLELGSYLAPAYAGMVLAEQGHRVEKWTTSDPIHDLVDGEQMWAWVNHGKTVRAGVHASAVADVEVGTFDVVLDNYRAATWARWGVDPAELAERLGVVWVSLRADDDGRSFDAIAQARAWGDKAAVPFYLGDTAAGLWVAFKALAAPPGHHVVRQASALAKLVEGELVAPYRAWDRPGEYVWSSPDGRPAAVDFRGEVVVEPPRDDEWRRGHLRHVDGRYLI